MRARARQRTTTSRRLLVGWVLVAISITYSRTYGAAFESLYHMYGSSSTRALSTHCFHLLPQLMHVMNVVMGSSADLLKPHTSALVTTSKFASRRLVPCLHLIVGGLSLAALGALEHVGRVALLLSLHDESDEAPHRVTVQFMTLRVPCTLPSSTRVSCCVPRAPLDSPSPARTACISNMSCQERESESTRERTSDVMRVSCSGEIIPEHTDASRSALFLRLKHSDRYCAL